MSTLLPDLGNLRQEYIARGGKFTFSDDSHGVAQVGTNYAVALAYLEELGVESVWTLEKLSEQDSPGLADPDRPKLLPKAVPIRHFKSTFQDGGFAIGQ